MPSANSTPQGIGRLWWPARTHRVGGTAHTPDSLLELLPSALQSSDQSRSPVWFRLRRQLCDEHVEPEVTPLPEPQHAPTVLGVTLFDETTTLSGSVVATSFDGMHLGCWTNPAVPARATSQSTRSTTTRPRAKGLVTDAIASMVLSGPPGGHPCRLSAQPDLRGRSGHGGRAGGRLPPAADAQSSRLPSTGAYIPTIHDSQAAEAPVQAAIDWKSR
jgi:hypothetical protein